MDSCLIHKFMIYLDNLIKKKIIYYLIQNVPILKF